MVEVGKTTLEEQSVGEMLMEDLKKAIKTPEGEIALKGVKDTIPITKKEKTPYFIFEKEGQVRTFIKEQPMFFDKTEMFWFWNKEQLKWEMVDKTEILNGIRNNLGVNTIASKERTEILNALQQIGREHMPDELSRECVQFKDKIINIKTGEEFNSEPKYFSTSPISWKIGESEDTPIMDKLFGEWVGEDYVETLYEIMAYCCSSDQFMQRMFALVGGGSNGKGTFIKLLKKFIGKDNSVSSELSVLTSSQFATSSIYKKLLCEMGEVSYNDLKNTNQIKKLSGEDSIRYEFKGKTPFSEDSPTTCIINTNSLPTTPDKTLGFYRRWLIVDFPNQFPIKEGIVETIPDLEFENLARKSIRILKELYKSFKFTNEGDYQERANRYEERSNPLMRFIEEFCEEDYEEYLNLNIFTKKINSYLKNKHLRPINSKEIKKSLGDEGFNISRTTKNYIKGEYIFNLKLKDYPINPINPQISNSNTMRTMTLKKVDKVDKVDNNNIFDDLIVKNEEKSENKSVTDNTDNTNPFDDLEVPK